MPSKRPPSSLHRFLKLFDFDFIFLAYCQCFILTKDHESTSRYQSNDQAVVLMLCTKALKTLMSVHISKERGRFERGQITVSNKIFTTAFQQNRQLDCQSLISAKMIRKSQ